MAQVEDAHTGEMVTVHKGDWVSFKCDIEQAGMIVRIEGNKLTLTTDRDNGFIGEYIGGCHFTTELASDCWVE